MSTIFDLSPALSYFILSLGGHACICLPNGIASCVFLIKSPVSQHKDFIGVCTWMLNNHGQAIGEDFQSSRGCVIPDVITFNMAVSHTK